VTIAIRPFVGRDGQDIKLIWAGRQANFLEIVIFLPRRRRREKTYVLEALHGHPAETAQASGAGACRENPLGLK
jgi:hypothetical protein